MKSLPLIAILALLPLAHADTLLGPTPYLQFSDSPFSGGSFTYFYLETFEDHLLNTPGVTGGPAGSGVTSVVFGPSIHDSVDADDGSIDGSGLLGDSYFSGNGAAGVTFTFDKNVLGTLPDSAGLVWTDGAFSSAVTFQVFGPGHVLLDTIGPSTGFEDNSNNGETAEDRFFGVVTTSPGGIESILMSNPGGGIEVDHLQYGLSGTSEGSVPEPGSWLLLGSALCAVGYRVRRRVN